MDVSEHPSVLNSMPSQWFCVACPEVVQESTGMGRGRQTDSVECVSVCVWYLRAYAWCALFPAGLSTGGPMGDLGVLEGSAPF